MDDCLSLCNLLKAAAACCERQLNEALADLDVSHCQATILLKLAEGPVSMSALSKEMCCHKSNITQVVSGLAKKGYIESATGETDRRVRELRLTAKGKHVGGSLKNVLCTSANACMTIFSAAERKSFTMLLKKYIEKHRG